MDVLLQRHPGSFRRKVRAYQLFHLDLTLRTSIFGCRASFYRPAEVQKPRGTGLCRLPVGERRTRSPVKAALTGKRSRGSALAWVFDVGGLHLQNSAWGPDVTG